MAKTTETKEPKPDEVAPDEVAPDESGEVEQAAVGDYADEYPDHDFDAAAIVRRTIRSDGTLVVTLEVPARSSD